MEKTLDRTNLLQSVLLGLLVFGFFFFYYPYHLHYQEQFQLFLNTSDYMAERTARPGGFSEYIAGFFIQFFYYRWAGALIIAVLLVLIQRLLLSVSCVFKKNTAFSLLSVIPALLYWALLCDESYLFGGVVAVILALLPMPLYQRISSYCVRLVYLLIVLPALYWFAGGIFLVFGLLAIAWEYTKANESFSRKAIITLTVCLMCAGLPFLAKNIILQYPFAQLFYGVTYYRYTQFEIMPILVIALSVVVIPLLFYWFPLLSKKKTIIVTLFFQFVLLTAGGFYHIRQAVDLEKEEVMAYDYHVRMQNWDEIIRMADKNAPSSSLSASCLNLALCKKGIMGDRMFHYYQNGTAGLFPKFIRDFTVPFIGGEIYYHLGFINTAQRYAFEAMEALPDYQKSVRAIKRLAETNIINGEYTVAGKYLRLLQQTTVYKKWADNTILALESEASIEANQEWNTLRKYRTKTDFLFSESEKEMMLGTLLQQNLSHRIAYEYLMAYCLLTKDLQHFYTYYPLGKNINYEKIPIHYQEALIYIWSLKNQDPIQEIPYPVSDEVKNNLRTYGSIYSSNKDPRAMLRKQFTGTYWYYFHFRKHNQMTYEDLYDVYADSSSPVSPGL